MSNTLHINGTLSLDVAASDSIAVFSSQPVEIYQRAGYPNYPDTWSLLQAVAANTEYISAAFSAATEIRIEGSPSADVLYQAGTFPVITERRGLRGQGAPGVLDATGALTSAMILSGIVTSAAATVAGTVPTGTVLDAAVELAIGESVDWSVIKVGANAFTVTAATGHTLVGDAVVATATSAVFRSRKTAANTFVTYRIG